MSLRASRHLFFHPRPHHSENVPDSLWSPGRFLMSYAILSGLLLSLTNQFHPFIDGLFIHRNQMMMAFRQCFL